ncbi:MAG: transposase [Pirellulaceae bacterium]|nr:MAG: transposase [Pirellulaceae bacterium]
MLSIAAGVRIYVYTRPADLRRGISGLSGLVREQLNADPLDGSLYVFINRRQDRMKVLHYERGGFWLYYRVLEAGTFESLRPNDGAEAIELDTTQLSMLLAGVSLVGSDRRRKRFALSRTQAA